MDSPMDRRRRGVRTRDSCGLSPKSPVHIGLRVASPRLSDDPDRRVNGARTPAGSLTRNLLTTGEGCAEPSCALTR